MFSGVINHNQSKILSYEDSEPTGYCFWFVTVVDIIHHNYDLPPRELSSAEFSRNETTPSWQIYSRKCAVFCKMKYHYMK